MADLSAPVPIDQLVAASSILSIEELAPTTPGGQPKQVVLVGPALPLKGAEWGGDSNIKTTWYPGNGVEATQQFLGPMELPSEWTGMWRRTTMGRTPSIYRDETGTVNRVIEPWDLWEILDAIRLGGARIRVTWAVRGRRLLGMLESGTDLPVDRQVIREGRLKSLKIQADTEVDLKWTAGFEWASRGGRQERQSDVRRDDDLSQATSAAQNAIAALDDVVDSKIASIRSGVRLSASTLTLGQLEAMANAPLDALNAASAKLRYNLGQLKRVGDLAAKIGALPYAMANACVDFARNTTAVANQFVQEFGTAPPEKLALKSKVSDLLRAVKYFGGANDQMQTISREGAALDSRMRQTQVSGGNRGAVAVRESSTTRAGDIVAIHVCKEGDTPVTLSVKYYLGPDHGPEILRANRLPAYTARFDKGQILVIPVLSKKPRTF